MNEDIFGKYEWEGKTILIVEDDISSTFYLKEILDETGADLLFASDGGQAVKLVSEHPELNLVLMDIQIPILDGYATTIEIKRMNPELPVIAQTAYALVDDREKCMNAGCDGYLAKPIDPMKLLETLSPYID